MFDKLVDLLKQRKDSNTYRSLSSTSNLVDFCSNDYLGLGRLNYDHIKVSGGATGSRLISGNYPLIQEFEEQLAFFHQSETALVYTSGYTANVGLFSSVPRKGDTIFYDELIHASVKDGMRLSYAKHYSFKHNNCQDLQSKLNLATGAIYVVVESIYSMDGDQAPLKELVKLCEENNCCLIVDEAHSVGVYGEKGEGLVQNLGLEKSVPIRVVTFGKAIGGHGAAVLCNEIVRNFVINYSRSFIYTTANSPHTIAQNQVAYQLMQNTELVAQLRKVITLFKSLQEEFPQLNWISSDSAIQCLVIGEVEETKAKSEELLKNGFDVRAILAPTVPVGSERLRICLHAYNTPDELKRIFYLLNK